MLAVLVLMVVLAGPQPEVNAVDSGLSLRVQVESPIVRGKSFRVRFSATNLGPDPVYFKRPWKWASNGLLLRARGSDGTVIESSTVLFDIESRFVCGHVKPLLTGETLEFVEELGWNAALPSLLLKAPGAYELEWVYEPKVYDSDEACAPTGWPIWRERTSSPSVSVVVK